MWSGAQVDLTGLYKDVGFHGEIPGSLVQVQLTPTEQLSFKSSDTTTILDAVCVCVALIDHEREPRLPLSFRLRYVVA